VTGNGAGFRNQGSNFQNAIWEKGDFTAKNKTWVNGANAKDNVLKINILFSQKSILPILVAPV
jgi:hypothetical protein